MESPALYARISTEDQSKGYSIEEQEEWARELDPNVVVYKDAPAHSDSVDRKGLQALCRAVVDGRVKTLLLKYNDRLGRGAVFATLVGWLKAWGIRIVCGDLPDVGDATDYLQSFYAAHGGMFLKTLRARTAEGVARAKQAGKHVGNTLLGFHWETGKWVPEDWALKGQHVNLKPWQAKRVREAIRAYRDGTLDELVRARSSASQERYKTARKKQELRAREFEQWLLQHRPLTYDRVSL